MGTARPRIGTVNKKFRKTRMIFSKDIACFILLATITRVEPRGRCMSGPIHPGQEKTGKNWLGEEDYLFMPKSMQEDYLFDDKTLKCLVCKAIVWEIEYSIDKMDPSKKVLVGSYSHTKHPTRNFGRSQEHLHYMVDNICKHMNDYVQARNKSTGEVTILRFKLEGYMNPKLPEVNLVHGRSHIVPDEHLQLKLKLHCESIMEDLEFTITEIFAREDGEDMDNELCYKRSDICKHVNLKQEVSKANLLGYPANDEPVIHV